MAIFSKMMVCKNCGSAMSQHRNENGRNYWSCQRTDKCSYILVSEDAMVEFIGRRLWYEERTPMKIQRLIETKVEKIEVNDTGAFTVSISGQEPMVWDPPNIYY